MHSIFVLRMTILYHLSVTTIRAGNMDSLESMGCTFKNMGCILLLLDKFIGEKEHLEMGSSELHKMKGTLTVSDTGAKLHLLVWITRLRESSKPSVSQPGMNELRLNYLNGMPIAGMVWIQVAMVAFECL